jgi:hypothetical protein
MEKRIELEKRGRSPDKVSVFQNNSSGSATIMYE